MTEDVAGANKIQVYTGTMPQRITYMAPAARQGKAETLHPQQNIGRAGPAMKQPSDPYPWRTFL